MVLILTTIVFLYHYYEEGQTTGRNMLVRTQRINHIIQLNCKLLSLYLVDRASFSKLFYFFTNLIHLVFFTILAYLSLHVSDQSVHRHEDQMLNPLNAELNPICYLLALLGAHHFLHVSRIRVKLLTLRRLMLYIYGAPILDVSRSHTTTQHSR